MRPINLIPVEQRRGAARGPGGGPSVGVYALLGGLGIAVVCALALVLLTNSVTEKQEKLAGIQAQAQGERQVADALRPYGQFADLQRARHQQISALATGRFDWERALRQLALALPRNVYLLDVGATGSPDVDIQSGGGQLSDVRNKSQGPAFTLTGCTYSQHAVARMMTRMRNLDDVTKVTLAKSERKDDATGAQGGPGTVTSDSQQTEEITDCIGSSRVTKFDLLVLFGGAVGETGSPTAAGAAGVPAGSATATAAAQGATGAASGGGTE
jgi:Tfp pilus assembly protein PilN